MNKKYKWFTEFLANLIATHLFPESQVVITWGDFLLLDISPKHWHQVANAALIRKYRFIGMWAQEVEAKNCLQVFVGFEHKGEYFFLRATLPFSDLKLDSIATYYPAAARMERHIHDLFGINFNNSLDARRWTRHQAWVEYQFPLRKHFSKHNFLENKTKPDFTYPFVSVEGLGVCTIPVGPVHAGIIEPGHFHFQVAGEDILLLEERLGYVHKGIEKIAEGRDFAGLIKIATRVSGDSPVAHAWAASQACERACRCDVPERALFLRAIMAEHERIANHLGDFGAICNDVGYSFAYYQLTRLKELWLRLNLQIFKHRLMFDCLQVGGVNIDIDDHNRKEMLMQISVFRKELASLYQIFEENSSLHDRLKNTGCLSFDDATRLGALGYTARASGCTFDLRCDAPYAPYDRLKIKVPAYNTCDVLARVRVRAQEILVALDLIEQMLDLLPAGAINLDCAPQAAEGVGLIEGFRGEIFAYVRLDEKGKVDRYFPRDPSWFNWLALEKLIHGNIVPDFPVCNKSINGSYSGVDL